MPKRRIHEPVEFRVETRRGNFEPVTFCAKRLAKAGSAPLGVMRPHLSELLLRRSRVPDAWRYCFTIEHGRVSGHWEPASGSHKLVLSDFPDDSDMTPYRGGLDIILLVLESPHVSEFRLHPRRHRVVPKGPAQGLDAGDAGGAIERYGLEVLDLLAQEHTREKGQPFPDGRYALVLVNPISYLTSLHWMDVLTGHASVPSGPLKRPVRNHVWTQLWRIPNLQKDFIRRCKRYAPLAILNCCTAALKVEVTRLLYDSGFGSITYCAFHPAYNWKNGIANPRRPITVSRTNCLPVSKSWVSDPSLGNEVQARKGVPTNT